MDKAILAPLHILYMTPKWWKFLLNPFFGSNEDTASHQMFFPKHHHSTANYLALNAYITF